MSLFSTFSLKCRTAGRRGRDIFRLFPRRAVHLVRHLAALFERKEPGRSFSTRLLSLGGWSLELFLLLLDAFGVAEIYETAADFVKFNSRPLSRGEQTLARSVFGDSIDLKRVRLDERAWLGPRQAHFCYVSFFHINSWGVMTDELLIHELMHVWQYQHLGISYIPRALRAQWSRAGYNYGGRHGLRAALREDKGLFDFNYEQQADIVADYFRIREGKTPRWGDGAADDLPLYRVFVGELQES